MPSKYYTLKIWVLPSKSLITSCHRTLIILLGSTIPGMPLSIDVDASYRIFWFNEVQADTTLPFILGKRFSLLNDYKGFHISVFDAHHTHAMFDGDRERHVYRIAVAERLAQLSTRHFTMVNAHLFNFKGRYCLTLDLSFAQRKFYRVQNIIQPKCMVLCLKRWR